MTAPADERVSAFGRVVIAGFDVWRVVRQARRYGQDGLDLAPLTKASIYTTWIPIGDVKPACQHRDLAPGRGWQYCGKPSYRGDYCPAHESLSEW